MRIERARTDFLSFDQFRPREFLGLSLVRKCFARPCVPSLSHLLFECDVPRALGLISHESLARGRSFSERSYTSWSPSAAASCDAGTGVISIAGGGDAGA